MNLQQIMRAVVCAALVALGITGTGLLPTQPVSGQETEPVTLHGAAALDQLKQTKQYESLQAALNQARFSVSRAEQTPLGRPAWHAPNTAAGYDAYVTEAGVSIIAKGAVNDESHVSLHLHSLGYGAGMSSVAPGKVSGDKQTINISREGGVREWFVNGADGLEHSFTLSEPPGARTPDATLRLALQVSTGWRAVASAEGKFVTLRGPKDEAVEYGKLVVRDNLGRNINARLTVAGEQVVIEVEDSEAAYPLTIDPLFTLQQKLLAADGAANDLLGFKVALSGNTALVGAPYADQTRGAAYVFVRNGATWTQQARLNANDGAEQDYFGWSVALKGDLALVGAIYGPGSLDPEQGAVYVFVRGGTTWNQQAKLNANENTQGAQFGEAVALDGDTALVGAPAYTITPSFAVPGAVFIFVRNGTTWTQQARLLANDGEDGDSFGVTVALEGDTALVGAPNNAVTVGGQGAAYVFMRSGTNWTQQQRLIAVNASADDHFGNAVVLSGDKALIGAYLQGSDDRGAVYDFRRGATGWAQTSRFFAPNPTAGAQFGVSVALSGDTAVVGASLGLFQPGADQRSAYVFVNGGEWLPVRQFGPELGTADDRFGYAVALDGDTVLVGAYRGDAAANDQGAAYAFVLHDSRHVEQQKLTANDGGTFDQFGNAVALDGDTLAVGAQWDDVGMNGNQGSAYIFTRNGTVWTFQQKLTAIDGAAEDWFGNAVALSGNTVAVGAYQAKIGANSLQGAVYVFTRSGATWTQQQKLTANDGAASNLFGQAVALSGNTVAVGAYQAKIGTNGLQGAAYVFTRSGTTWTFQQKLTANDGALGDQFGWSVALNGDTGAVGAFGDTLGANSQQGSAYVFVRNGTTWAQQQKLTANDGAAQDRFGSAVALSGDTVVVGANQDKIGTNVNQGSAYVFARSGTAWTQQQKLTAADGGADDRFGAAVALGGDTLVVGTLSNSLGLNSNPGSAYVFTRIGSWFQQQKLTASDGASQDFFGGAVALSGDTVVVGAPGDKIGNNEDQGSAYVFVSPPCPAITLAPASLPDGVPGVAYDQPITESGGGVGEYLLSVSRGALPPGLTLGSVPGRLYGTPATPGTYRFTITTTHLLSLCTGSREYTLAILPCPTITVGPAALPIGVLGAAYGQSVTASADGGGTAAYGFAVTAGALPPSLGLNTNGILSGTPTQPGSYNFTVTASLTTTTCTGTRAYTLTILPACPTLTVTPPVLPNGAVGTPYSHAVTVTGGAEPYLIGLNLGSNLPPGMSFVNGVLAGTPTQAGMYSFLARIRDANGCQGAQGYTVTINPPCPPITINPATLPNGAPGAAYSQTLTVSVSTFAASFAVTAGALPPGLSLSAGGVLSGTPTQAGSYNFTVTASANGCMGERAYTLTINSPPAISAAAVSYQAGSSAANKVIANVSDANQPAATLTVTVNGGASATVGGITLSSLSINAAGAVSASVVAACGAANAAFTLTVTDNASAAANATLNVTVTANSPPALNYAVQSVAAGGGLTINPASGPSDNGAIASIAAQSPGTFTGTLAVNPTTGVVTVSNAKPGGTHNITIRATDNCGATQDALLRLDVTCPAITLDPPALPGGNVGVSYNQTLTASGGTPGYSFSVNPIELPHGLTLSANGTLNGTPTSTYGGGFNVTATDTNGCRGTRFYSFTVNAPPTITALSGNARQGSPASRLDIATVSDNQFANTLTVTVNGAASATVNGVTVSNISASLQGAVEADIIAACTAANASFTLTVTDDFGLTADATLNISVTANSVPVLSYGNQSLALGGGLTINPASGPSDNGGGASIAVQSQGTFTGTLTVNPGTGVVTVNNAQPSGAHTIAIRAT
ncbi:MAG: putative Ig domain-containing protein, partial [Acidobacteriota bacterium]